MQLSPAATPFGRSVAFLASGSSLDEPLLDMLRSLADVLPFRTEDPPAVGRWWNLELEGRLATTSPDVLRNTICIVKVDWNSCESFLPLECIDAVVRFPEVYWVFLTDGELSSLPRSVYDHHIVASSHRADDLRGLLRRHISGFRAWFDPTGFRALCSQHLRELPARLGGHSAPFLHQTVSSALLKRTAKIAKDVVWPVDAAHGALLALEAWQLLGGQTLALCLDALLLLHRMEATMECAFVGSAGSLPVQSRFGEVVRSIADIPRITIPAPQQKPKTLGSSMPSNDAAAEVPALAASVDEEEAFVVVNAYVLFRHGFRVLLVPSLAAMRDAFGEEGTDSCQPVFGDVSLTLEDVDLRFGDADLRHTVSTDWNARAKRFPLLASCRRIAISAVPETLPSSLTRIPKPHRGVFGEIANELNKYKGRDRLLSRICLSELSVGCPSNRVHRYQRANAKVEIADELRQVYRTFDQLEEEDEALGRIRAFRFELWISACTGWRRWKLVQWPFRKYFNFVVASIPRLLFLIAAWIVILSCAYWYFAIPGQSITACIKDSFLAFVEMQPPPGWVSGPWALGVLSLALVLAYVHLGIFISMLYQRISRRS